VAHRDDGVAILGVVGAVAVTTVKGPVRGVGHHIDTVHATVRGGSVLVILQYTPKNMADVRIQTGYVRGSDIFESASPLKRLLERLEVWDQLEKNIYTWLHRIFSIDKQQLVRQVVSCPWGNQLAGYRFEAHGRGVAASTPLQVIRRGLRKRRDNQNKTGQKRHHPTHYWAKESNLRCRQ